MNCTNPMCKHGQDQNCCNPIHDTENKIKKYRKKGTQAMRPYIPGEDLTNVSVSVEDTPEVGGMIAIGADNDARWYVSKTFFNENYVEYSNSNQKAATIEVIEWTGYNLNEVIKFTGQNVSVRDLSWGEYEELVGREGLKIFTLEGSCMASVGDYIIKSAKGGLTCASLTSLK